MQATTTPDTGRYSRPAVLLHWAMALVIAIGYLAIEMRGPKGSESRVFWTGVHLWCGSLVLALAVLRILWRLWRGAPPEIAAARIATFLARLVHVALYVFIVAQPLLGILMLNTGGHPLVLPGVGVPVTLVGADPLARTVIHRAHVLVGNFFYFVIGLHALAAIGHHVVFRDATLRRML